MTDWVNRCINESVNQWITDSGSVNYIYIYTYIYIFPDLHDHHDPSWCWEYMYICMWQLWWTRVADFAAVLAVKPCVLCPFIGWSLGILIISYTAIVPAYPKHSTSNAFLELVYNCQHTLLFFQLLSYLLVHLLPASGGKAPWNHQPNMLKWQTSNRSPNYICYLNPLSPEVMDFEPAWFICLSILIHVPRFQLRNPEFCHRISIIPWWVFQVVKPCFNQTGS